MARLNEIVNRNQSHYHNVIEIHPSATMASSSTTEDGQRQERTGDSAAGAPPCHRYTSAELFQGSRDILIVHGDRTYRLRITRQDKLILTK